jgi:hypothetical protein
MAFRRAKALRHHLGLKRISRRSFSVTSVTSVVSNAQDSTLKRALAKAFDHREHRGHRDSN